MRVLVTGAAGMIGSQLVKSLNDREHEVYGIDRSCGNDNRATYIVDDLCDTGKLRCIMSDNRIERVIHLAALAHTAGETDLSWSRYYHVNVECAVNVFNASGERPVLFISTVDVFGRTKGTVNGCSEIHPISLYSKSKAIAESECRAMKNYSIFRLSPVYSQESKRDIQKRYYLRYPNWAYIIGKGTDYEVLDINNAVKAMADWCEEDTLNDVRILKDSLLMNTADYINMEKSEGRAKHVLYFPKWLVNLGYKIVSITGDNKYSYLISKAVYPIRTE